MPDVDARALAAECAVLARYLCGAAPGEYVTRKYIQAHERSEQFAAFSRFDRLLLRWGTRSAPAARLVDAYGCLFARRSAFRRKLVLLLAILEVCPDDPAGLDRARGGPWSIAFYVLLRGAVFALTLLAAAIVLLPAQLALGGVRAPRGGGHS
jgi:hypothetical protein